MNLLDRIIALINILISAAFLFLSIKIIIEDGGNEGIGYLILPFLLFLATLVIPSILTFFKKHKLHYSLAVNSFIFIIYVMSILFAYGII